LLVFRVNTYTSATMDIADGQRVITTGPSGLVRHPMYACVSLLALGAALALGSYWGRVPATAVILDVMVRLLDDERFLRQHLAGYGDYRAKVRARLVAFLW
jgi:protein-S-isoprenylcysteine O-methyltransferase Ste14